MGEGLWEARASVLWVLASEEKASVQEYFQEIPGGVSPRGGEEQKLETRLEGELLEACTHWRAWGRGSWKHGRMWGGGRKHPLTGNAHSSEQS